MPVITLVTGEGSSGGALAISVANSLWMLENAVYSVLSPEGFAAILWKDGSRAADAAELMKLTAQELAACGVADRVIPEPEHGFTGDCTAFYRDLREQLIKRSSFSAAGAAPPSAASDIKNSGPSATAGPEIWKGLRYEDLGNGQMCAPADPEQ